MKGDLKRSEALKLIRPGEIRVRIAPSPTGPLHIGTARTTLFNYLFAKKYKGSFILRIEDTDIGRSTKEFEEDIKQNLKWLGLEWDEGPYRQSERKEIYRKYIEKLLKEKSAYCCFCSKEELEEQRQYKMSIGEPPLYSGKCRNLTPAQIKKNLGQGKPFIIRFNNSQKTDGEKIIFNDLIRGKIEFNKTLLGDFAIAKSLDAPLYNLVVVIDDFKMKITHIIRGEDHISNTPKQILLQKVLKLPQPKYAHLPLILGPDKSKLSKRHNTVAVSKYRKDGYLPEALINFMVLLGWNPKDNREIFSLPSLIKEFTFEGIQKAGAIFNISKLDWINGFYIRQKSIKKLTELCLPYLIEKGLVEPIFKTEQYPPAYGGKIITPSYQISETRENINFENLEKIINLYQERLKKLSEIVELTDFFFRLKLNYPKELLRWKDMTDKEIKESLDKLTKVLGKIKEKNWTALNLEEILLKEVKAGRASKDRGYLLWPLRVALTGKKTSAGPFEIAEILGKEKTLKRIKEAINIII
ncbi:glutamate--tRNA ligase [bacterium (Candidatus Gribaldobacteria) CG_4_9_14_3_um_filter_33_9]|nr:MAG: glutamate--tRNA ligase [bacterium (Candidatus Gribaldobacteria) CG_4_9_14_3_um_filter_33_9]